MALLFVLAVCTVLAVVWTLTTSAVDRAVAWWHRRH